jgi:hypothetical protein
MQLRVMMASLVDALLQIAVSGRDLAAEPVEIATPQEGSFPGRSPLRRWLGR